MIRQSPCLGLYSPAEIGDLLNKVGLRIYKMYGNCDIYPFTNESRKMIIIPRKEFCLRQLFSTKKLGRIPNLRENIKVGNGIKKLELNYEREIICK